MFYPPRHFPSSYLGLSSNIFGVQITPDILTVITEVTKEFSFSVDVCVYVEVDMYVYAGIHAHACM